MMSLFVVSTVGLLLGLCGLQAEAGGGGPLELAGVVEMSAGKVRLDTNPHHEFIMIIVSVEPQGTKAMDAPGVSRFVMEGDPSGPMTKHFRGAGKIVYCGDSLEVWNGPNVAAVFVRSDREMAMNTRRPRQAPTPVHANDARGEHARGAFQDKQLAALGVRFDEVDVGDQVGLEDIVERVALDLAAVHDIEAAGKP